MAVWSEEAITTFISLYKKHPCLWKLKSPDYNNRLARTQAYEEIVTYCKKIGFKKANRDFAVKKIQSLRGAFRKELKKIMFSLETAKSEEDAYKPSLFYFDMLMFTKDQEIGEEENEAITNQEEEESNDGSWQEDATNIATINVCQFPDTSSAPSNAISIDGRFCQRDEIASSSTNQGGTRDLKRKHSPEKSTTFGSLYRDISETDAFGIIVSRKLQKMSRVQAVYAETIMINVLRKGLLDTLTADTDLCDNHCSKNFIG